jgi:Rhomboid family
MDRWLARLERRIGSYAVPNLIRYIVGGMAIIWVLSLSRPEVVERLMLDMAAVRRGQVWRLLTFLFIPPRSSPIWVIVNLYFTWWVGTALEQHWGTFKFNAYYFIGVLCTILAALATGPASNMWLDSSLFLAFATTFPNVSILLFFVVPVRVKWLGLVAALGIVAAFVLGDWSVRASIAAALVAYVIFFWEHWVGLWKGRSLVGRQKARREEIRSTAPVLGQRVCAMCGAREVEGADIRVCSCDKCGRAARFLCLSHARNH